MKLNLFSILIASLYLQTISSIEITNQRRLSSEKISIKTPLSFPLDGKNQYTLNVTMSGKHKIPMIPLIYSNSYLLYHGGHDEQSCDKTFQKAYCKNLGCTILTDGREKFSDNYAFIGNKVVSDMILKHPSNNLTVWGGDSSSGVYAKHCFGKYDQVSKPYSYGTIGFSIEKNNWINGVVKFSININDNKKEGELIIGENKQYFTVARNLIDTGVRKDWSISFSKIDHGNRSNEISGDIVFDLSYTEILMPDPIYTLFNLTIRDYVQNCTMKKGNQYCNLTSTEEKMPDFVIEIDVYRKLTIPSEIYFGYDQTLNSFKLNVKSTTADPEQLREGQILVQSYFVDSIILGTQFFHRHYVIFNIEDASITLYDKLASKFEDVGLTRGQIILILVAGSIAIVALGIGIICVLKKRSFRRQYQSAQSGRKPNDTELDMQRLDIQFSKNETIL